MRATNWRLDDSVKNLRLWTECSQTWQNTREPGETEVRKAPRCMAGSGRDENARCEKAKAEGKREMLRNKTRRKTLKAGEMRNREVWT